MDNAISVLPKIKRGKIKIGIYETVINMIIVPEDIRVVQQVKKILKKHKSEIDADLDGGLICNGFAILLEQDPLIGYLIFSMESLTVNVVTHETDHMRKYILDFKDIEDHEASANLNAYINQEVFRFAAKSGLEIRY